MSKPDPILLLTRPRADAERFLAALGETGFGVIISPVTRIARVKTGPLPQTGDLVLTSAHAVPSGGAGRMAWCVGERTAEAARQAGLDARSADGSAEDLLALLNDARPAGPLLYLRGECVATDLAAALREAGHSVEERIVYRQESRPLSKDARIALDGVNPVLLPVFSPRSARALGDLRGLSAPRHVIAISPAVAERAADLDPASVTLAARPDLPAMVEATQRAAAAL